MEKGHEDGMHIELGFYRWSGMHIEEKHTKWFEVHLTFCGVIYDHLAVVSHRIE